MRVYKLSCEEIPFSAWQTPWNPTSHVPMELWLKDELTPEERLRLKSMGNIVVPKQAALGACVLAKMQDV